MKAVCLIAKIGQIIPVIDFYPQQIKDRETKSSLDFVTCRVADMGQVESNMPSLFCRTSWTSA